MSAPDVLSTTVRHTHETLAARLDTVSTMVSTPGQPRKAYEGIDTFLAVASKHLNAVDATLLPSARKELPDGADVVHDYLGAARELELALTHVKARAYGSTFEAGHHWDAVWTDVRTALEAHRRAETDLAARLTDGLEPAPLDALAESLHRAESKAPSRPHPYAPHTGVAGALSRRVMHVVDSFWDTAEGRMSPSPEHPPHKAPGRFAQYVLGDPRFEVDTDDEGRE